MKRLILLLCLLLLAAPVIAQDVEATPDFELLGTVVVDVPATGDITVESGGQLVIGQTDPAPTPEPDTAISNDTILIVGVLLVGIGSIVFLVLRGGNPDVIATERLQIMQMNRDAMAAQERAYANASATQRQAIDTLAGVVSSIAPLTPAMLDDALARYLKDVQIPGPPPT